MAGRLGLEQELSTGVPTCCLPGCVTQGQSDLYNLSGLGKSQVFL